MSVNISVIFENNIEKTQKKFIVNIGWFTPSDFDLFRYLKEAEESMNPTYIWDRLVLPRSELCMSNKDFNDAKYVYNVISSIDYNKSIEFRQGFTLKNKLTPCSSIG